MHSASAASAIVSTGSNKSVLATSPELMTPGVRMAHCGVRAFTAIPWPSFSPAAATVNRLSAAFVAPYIALPSLALNANGGPGGSSPLKLVRLRIHPRPRARIPGRTWAMCSQGAQTLTCWYRSSSSIVHWSTGFRAWATALLTKMSIGPNAASVRSTSVARPPSGSPRSHGITKPAPPTSSMRASVSCSPSSERAVIPTLAPSAARRIATDRPVPPRLAPVTSATNPSQLRAIVASFLSYADADAREVFARRRGDGSGS